MRKISKLFIFICSVLFLSACNATAVESKDYSPDETNVKFLGRAYYAEEVLWMCHSGTGAAFEVDAKKLEITILGDNRASMVEDDGSAARIAVVVNGKRLVDEMIIDTFQTFTVFDEAKPVKGEVQVIKLSESANSLAGLMSITVDGKGSITPAREKDLKIEFIGDSITCGYGIDDPDRNHHFRTSTEDNTKTYAYKTAQLLKADYSMVSFSGFGIASGYTSNPNSANTNSLVPKYYDSLGFSWGNTILGMNPGSIEWDFSKFVPDVVVVNLGTNDHSYCQGNSKKKKEFQKKYVEFLKHLRMRNPDAYIVCTLGMMGADLFPEIEAAVKEMNDPKIVSLRLNSISASEGYAADWHPTEATNTTASVKLVTKIKELLK